MLKSKLKMLVIVDDEGSGIIIVTDTEGLSCNKCILFNGSTCKLSDHYCTALSNFIKSERYLNKNKMNRDTLCKIIKFIDSKYYNSSQTVGPNVKFIVHSAPSLYVNSYLIKNYEDIYDG